jgi:hypothetical protein
MIASGRTQGAAALHSTLAVEHGVSAQVVAASFQTHFPEEKIE